MYDFEATDMYFEPVNDMPTSLVFYLPSMCKL